MNPEVLRKDKHLLILVLLSLSFLGCSPIKVSDPTVAIASATYDLPIATSTSTPYSTPTSTQFLVQTATKKPEYVLADLHSEISYTIPLTSQMVSETRAVLHFRLDRLAEGFLFYGEISEGGFTERIPISGNDLDQLITIDGLELDTRYQIAVGLTTESGFRLPSFLEERWDPIQFRTLGTEGEPIRIGVIGDSGFGGGTTYSIVHQLAAHDLDFVLHTGDVVYLVEQNEDAVEAFSVKYFQPFSELLHELPVYTVPGNHEYDVAAVWEGAPYYYAAFPPLPDWISQSDSDLRQYYAFDVGSVQFLFLDTQVFWREQGASAQTQWLEERLSDDRFAFSIPVLHVPPFNSGLHLNDGVVIAREWVPLFERYRVPLVLSGHDHNYQRLDVNGITYVISGGGSGVLYPLGESHPGNKHFSARSHYVLLTLYKDRLELEAKSADGELIDSTVIELVQEAP